MPNRLPSFALRLALPLLVASCDRGNAASQLVKAPEAGHAAGSQTEPSQARLVSLPGGTFKMGERAETVTVQPFALDVTEVTADGYAACVRAGACTADGLEGEEATYGVAGKGAHPINYVDWNQATAYCRWAGERLPTEEEWEWAARGQGRGTTYPWGYVAPGSRACWNRQDGTCAVGSYLTGDAPGGIHDLAGNVSEWTASNYDAYARVTRGGGWGFPAASPLRAADRHGQAPASRGLDLGFRCARTP